MSENLWNILQEAFNAIAPHYRDKVRESMAEIGFEGPEWYMTYLAHGLDPKPLTAVTLQKIMPYGNKERQLERLQQTAKKGFLKEENGEFTITAKGRNGVEDFFITARDSIGKLEPLPPSQMDALAATLKTIVKHTLAASEPAEKNHLIISRATDFDDNANAAIQIDQYMTDLLHYRDDAHLAAWRTQAVDGPTWETFTLFWRGDVSTLAELVENRQPRGFEGTAVYEQAIQELIKRGWLMKSDEAYKVTEAGQKLRDAVEAKTNEYFFVGFSALDDAAIEELTSQLIQFKEGLAIPEEEAVPA